MTKNCFHQNVKFLIVYLRKMVFTNKINPEEIYIESFVQHLSIEYILWWRNYGVKGSEIAQR